MQTKSANGAELLKVYFEYNFYIFYKIKPSSVRNEIAKFSYFKLRKNN